MSICTCTPEEVDGTGRPAHAPSCPAGTARRVPTVADRYTRAAAAVAAAVQADADVRSSAGGDAADALLPASQFHDRCLQLAALDAGYTIRRPGTSTPAGGSDAADSR